MSEEDFNELNKINPLLSKLAREKVEGSKKRQKIFEKGLETNKALTKTTNRLYALEQERVKLIKQLKKLLFEEYTIESLFMLVNRPDLADYFTKLDAEIKNIDLELPMLIKADKQSTKECRNAVDESINEDFRHINILLNTLMDDKKS